MKKRTYIFVAILVSLGFAIAAVFVWLRLSDRTLDSYYTITDSFSDTSTSVSASVYFIKVTEYDSMLMLRSAERITKNAIESQQLNLERERDFLFHFFIPSDSSRLTPDIVDELAYTHPSIDHPDQKLVVVRNGWVIRATFAPGMKHPREVTTRQTEFYMPRAGIRAKDLR